MGGSGGSFCVLAGRWLPIFHFSGSQFIIRSNGVGIVRKTGVQGYCVETEVRITPLRGT